MGHLGGADPTGESGPWHPRRVLATLGTGLFGLGLAVGGYGAYVSALIAADVNPDAAGLGMSLFLLGQLVIVMPADRLTRRVSVERVAALGFAIGTIGIGLSGTTDVWGTYLARLAIGLGQGAAFVAAMKYVGVGAPPGHRAAMQGLLGAVFTLGLAVGIAATGPGIERFGLAGPAVIAATVTGIGAVGTLGLPATAGGHLVRIRAYLDPFRSRAGIALGLANLAAFGFLMVGATWYNELLVDHPWSAVGVLAGFALATVVGRGAGGWLSRSVGERTTVVGALIGLATVLGGLALALQVGSSTGLAVAVVASGLGFGIPFGPVFSLAFSTLTDDPGVTLTAMLILGNGGALVFPWLVGWLLAVTAGYAAGFGVMSLSVLGIVVLWHRWIGWDLPD